MCDPKTIAFNSAASSAFGAVNRAVGAYGEAQSQRNALRYSADAAEMNARIAELTAQSVLKQGEREYQRSRLSTAALKGRQRATMAARGIDLGEGTAARILTDTDVLGEIDANTIQANAIRQAWGHRLQGTNYSNEALFGRTTADTISPGTRGFTSLLGDAGSVAKKWYRYRKEF